MGFDRNTLIGISLIGALMFGYFWYISPTKEQIEKQKRAKDSTEFVQKQKIVNDSLAKRIQVAVANKDSVIVKIEGDSVKSVEIKNKYDVFASTATDEDANHMFIIENELLKVFISKKGGRVCSVSLKNYRRYDSTALILFEPDSSSFGLDFYTENNRTIKTNELFFQPVEKKNDSAEVLAMRLYANNDKSKYIEYEYSLPKNSYMLGCKLNIVGLQNVIASNMSNCTLNWAMKIPSQEMVVKNQQQASTVYYKYLDATPDNISEAKDETLALSAKTKWVAFKQQFFTSVLIADEFFDKSGADVTSRNEKSSTRYIKDYSANLTVPYSHKPNESFGMKFYFGPAQYNLLKKFDLDLERQISIGWSFAPIGWVNRFLVIPVFNFLSSLNLSYALIILSLTLVFKILLFPVAYKTYVSSAKMRVLKPEIDEINKKHGNDDPMKKQQATMALYRKAGVSPLAGCIPALLQMPILIALVRFFPASIELRQHGFWWVKDFSSYDSILNLGFNIPFYGDHISLWALLCTATTLIYTQMNSQLMSGTQNQQMPGMKYMMYIMPIFFLPFLNTFSAGLSYYYTLANVISFAQMWAIRKFLVDEKKLHAQIAEHMKKPVKQSGFQQKLQKRLEDIQKQRNGSQQKRVK